MMLALVRLRLVEPVSDWLARPCVSRSCSNNFDSSFLALQKLQSIQNFQNNHVLYVILIWKLQIREIILIIPGLTKPDSAPQLFFWPKLQLFLPKKNTTCVSETPSVTRPPHLQVFRRAPPRWLPHCHDAHNELPPSAPAVSLLFLFPPWCETLFSRWRRPTEVETGGQDAVMKNVNGLPPAKCCLLKGCFRYFASEQADGVALWDKNKLEIKEW